MNAEIVSIGTELLLGEIHDTNATYLAQRMKDIGLNLYYRTTVGDNEQRIADVLRLAVSRAEIVITTGGLGPTVDDMTRQSVAAAVGQTLSFRPELMEQIIARFANFRSRMTDNNRLQAMLPERAIAIENPVGTAPGFIVETERGGAIISLPGVPHEMQYLMEHRVIPYLREKIGPQAVIKLRILRTAGAGESWLGEQIADLMQLSNPTVGTAAHGGQTDVRITAKAEDEAAADALIAPIEAQLRARIGQYAFGVDKEPIEGALIAALRAANKSIDLYEAGTEGTLYKRLTEQPGGAAVIRQNQQFADADSLRWALSTDKIFEPDALIKALAHFYRPPDAAPAITVAIVTNSEHTLLVVADGDSVRHRSYAYGGAEVGNAEWMAGWAIGIGWLMLTQRPDPNPQAEPHPRPLSTS